MKKLIFTFAISVFALTQAGAQLFFDDNYIKDCFDRTDFPIALSVADKEETVWSAGGREIFGVTVGGNTKLVNMSASRLSGMDVLFSWAGQPGQCITDVNANSAFEVPAKVPGTNFIPQGRLPYTVYIFSHTDEDYMAEKAKGNVCKLNDNDVPDFAASYCAAGETDRYFSGMGVYAEADFMRDSYDNSPLNAIRVAYVASETGLSKGFKSVNFYLYKEESGSLELKDKWVSRNPQSERAFILSGIERDLNFALTNGNYYLVVRAVDNENTPFPSGTDTGFINNNASDYNSDIPTDLPSATTVIALTAWGIPEVIDRQNLHYGVYPNPAVPGQQVTVTGVPLDDTTEVQMYRIDGNVINISAQVSSDQRLVFNVPSNIPPAPYILKVINREHTQKLKLIVAE